MISDYFVCVGAQKAGTTWVLDILGRHPDVFATPVKEIHYFDHVAGKSAHLSHRRRRSRFRKYLQRLAFDWPRFAQYRREWHWWRDYMRDPIDDRWYEALFSHRQKARIAGEATPEYATLGEPGFRHIVRLAPAARAIFVMRSPLWQAWSQFIHFEERGDERGVRGGTAGAIAFWESAYSAPFRDYPQTIDDMLAVFGAERSKFLFHEDIHANRPAALGDLCAFLGIDFQAGAFGELATPVNVSKATPIPPELHDYLRSRYKPVVDAVIGRIGRVPESWTRDFL